MTRRSISIALVKLFLLALVIYFVGRHVASNWDRIRNIPFPDIPLLLLSSLFAFGTYVLVCYSCRYLLRCHGYRIPFRRVVGLMYLPMLGKYVPGKVWSVIAALHLYRREGLPNRVAAASISMMMASALVAASIVTLVFGGPLVSQSVGWPLFFLTIGGVLAFVYPPVFYGVFNSALRLLGRQPFGERLTVKALAKVVAILAASRVTFGLGFFLFANSFYEVETSHLPVCIAIFTLAQLAGFVAVFAPGGIGVREGVLLFGLEGILGAGPAIVLTAVCRLWQTVLELLMAAAGLGVLGFNHANAQESDETERRLVPDSNCKKRPPASA